MYMTVKELKEALESAHDDAPVYYQRIEDVYFEKHGWCGEKMKWEGEMSSEYVEAFTAYIHPETGAFVLNAHY